MFKKRPISKKRRAFRRILLSLAFLAFLFAAFMSFYYVGHKRGYLKQEDIAPTVFATDVYLYQIKSYWSDDAGKYKIAQKMIKLGFFDLQYQNAGLVLMHNLAETGHPPAQTYYANLLMEDIVKSKGSKQQKAMTYYREAAEQGYEPAQEKIDYYASLSSRTKSK